jgi:branched-chain amino acid transport system substrate-binding protein
VVRRLSAFLAVGCLMAIAGTAVAREYILIGNLIDFTGPTSVVGREYGQAKIDAANYINEAGGINGKLLNFNTVDYAYEVPRAIAAYRLWRDQGAVAIQGWGTADTEALVDAAAEDEIPYFSASYSAHLTDPAGEGPRTEKPAPYNFPMGPSYSDGVRALLDWAATDWTAKGGEAPPTYVHMGADHPYSNAPKAAGEEYAIERGFDVLPAIEYPLATGDFAARCRALQESGADYAFLANTSGANISLLKVCAELGVDTQFMANIWGYDENVMKAAGEAADGVVWVMGATTWAERVAGVSVLRDVSRMSDPKGERYRAVHYIRGVCAVFFLKEALQLADAMEDGITGANVKAAMYENSDWVPLGMRGVCPPGTWAADDHRGFNRVRLYRGHVTGPTDRPLAELAVDGTIVMEPILEVEIPRKPEWLGW